jgi:hypothetical protein
MIDEFLLMIIVAGMGLTVAYLRAEYVLHRRFKAAERERLSVRHELHANRLQPKQIDVPVAALRNHQHCLSKESALCAPDELPPTVYSRKSADVGNARHRELA